MKRPLSWIVWIIVILVLAAGIWYMGMGSQFGRNSTDYQAVFLANGQVYFGMFSDGLSGPRLADIYYLRVQRTIQPAGEEAQPDIQLVKLGNEVHGPKDEMRLNRDQILFIEDLKEDGKVVKAIREFQKTGGETTTDTQPQP